MIWRFHYFYMQIWECIMYSNIWTPGIELITQTINLLHDSVIFIKLWWTNMSSWYEILCQKYGPDIWITLPKSLAKNMEEWNKQIYVTRNSLIT